MEIHVEDLTQEISYRDGETPLSGDDLQRIVELVKEALAADRLAEDRRREAVEIRSSALPVDGGS